MRIGLLGRALSLCTLALTATAATTAIAAVCGSRGPGQFGEIFYCASSVLAGQGGISYGPLSAASGRNKAWVEGARGDGVGQWLTLRFEDGATFKTLWINNGYGRTSKTYRENNRVRTARITTSDGIVLDITLLDQYAKQRIRLPRVAKAKWVRITIRSVYRGSKYRDTAIGGFWADLEELN